MHITMNVCIYHLKHNPMWKQCVEHLMMCQLQLANICYQGAWKIEILEVIWTFNLSLDLELFVLMRHDTSKRFLFQTPNTQFIWI